MCETCGCGNQADGNIKTPTGMPIDKHGTYAGVGVTDASK